MVTQNELMKQMSESVRKADLTERNYDTVLTSEGERDVSLTDGRTTPNLNKRIAHQIGPIIQEFKDESGAALTELQESIDQIKNDGVTADMVVVGDSTLDVFAQQIKDQQLNYNKTVTVGEGGDFATINAALEELTKLHPCFITSDANLRAKILLKSGFVAKEQVNINGLHLSWIDIASEDTEVQVDRTFLTEKDDRWYYFIRCKNGSIPNIDVLFTMINRTANDDSTMLYMNHSSGFINQNKGFKNAGSRNVDLTQASSLACGRGIFTGAGVLNFRPATGSIVFMQFADVSGAPTGLSASTGATVSAANLICNNCETGISVQSANVDLTDAAFENNQDINIFAQMASSVINAKGVTVSGGNYAIYAQGGSSIDATDIKINNSTIAGIIAVNTSKIVAPNASIQNCTVGAISNSGSFINVSKSNINNCTTNSLYAQTGGTIIANDANYQKVVGTDSNTDAKVATRGTIVALNGVGGNSQKANKQTSAGLIDKGGLAKNNGNIVLPAGETSVVVNHGLSEMPISPFANPNGNISPATLSWCGQRTATTFTISVDKPLTQAMQFYWTAEI